MGPEGRGTTELTVELGVAQAQAPAAQDPGAALHPLAPAREELLGVPECQHPVLGVDLVLDFHHLLHPLSSSTGHQLRKLGSSLSPSALQSLKPRSLHSPAAQVFVQLTAPRCGGRGRRGQEVVLQQPGSTPLDLLPSVPLTFFPQLLFESLILFSNYQTYRYSNMVK